MRDIKMIDYNMNFIHGAKYGGIMMKKMMFYLNYFRRVKEEGVDGFIYIARNKVDSQVVMKNIMTSENTLCEVNVMEPAGTIEDNECHSVCVDFANMFIGGGCMENGNVQEEIMFLVYPELLVARLASEKMENDEAIFIKGVEKFSDYSGYGFGLKYAGSCLDPLKKERKDGIIPRDIVAIDALPFYLGNPDYEQFSQAGIFREIVKAYAGFNADTLVSPYSTKPIATGRWGCGAFMGTSQLKFIIQWIACSFLNRKMTFCPRDDGTLKRLSELCSKLTKSSVTINTFLAELLKPSNLTQFESINDIFNHFL